jgi:hypothetical protein
MNKAHLLKLALIIVLGTAAAASTAYASKVISGTTLLGGNSFSPSNNVSVYIATDGSGAGQGYDANTYSAKSKHQKGDKTVGCLAGDPKLYFYGGSSTADTSHVTPATNDSYTDTSIWTSM